MSRTESRRTLFGIALVLAVLFAVLVVLGRWLVLRSHPETDGEAVVRELESASELRRDELGVVHVRAQSVLDAYRSVGYAHAQDRLWQMELIRRVGEGRLAEVLGADALPVDRLFRTLSLQRTADSIVGSIDDETRSMLEAYAEGVNAGIRSQQGRFPLEFDILGFEPEPWQVRHSILVSRLMAWELDYSRWMDVLLSVFVDRFGGEKARKIFPDWNAGDPTIIRAATGIAGVAGMEEMLRSELSARKILGSRTLGFGSNAWVLSGSRTVTGKPFLANDPHLLLMVPARFYEVQVSAPGLDVFGATIPGVPFTIIGRNRSIAWGLTNAMIDDHDFYVEEVDSLVHPTSYRLDGSWVPLTIRTDTIIVRDADPIVFLSYHTHRGPIVNRMEPSARWSSSLISMRWTGHDVSNDARTFMMLNRARSWSDFTEALKHFNGPAQSFVYADTAGHIGYRVGGRVPVRPKDHALLPADGRSRDNDWKGVVPFASMPSVVDPPEGFIVSANNKITGPEYPYHLAHLWEPPWRARRLNDALEDLHRITIEDMQRLQNDVYSVWARDLSPLIVDVLGSDSADMSLSPYVAYLRMWDFQVRKEDVASSIFESFLHHMRRETFVDEMGPELLGVYDTLAGMSLTALDRLMRDPGSTWFDDVRTDTVEQRDDIIRRSFRLALQDLQRRLGTDVKTWRWERLHTLTFSHVMGAVPVLSSIFNVGPFSVAGSHATVNVGYYGLDGSFGMTVGPSYRVVFDLADVNGTRSVLPPGQSGHAFHSNYDSQVTMWLNGAYKIVPMDSAEVAMHAHDRLLLERE